MSGLRSIKRSAERAVFAKQIPQHNIMEGGRAVGKIKDLKGKMSRAERRQVAQGLMRKMLAGERPS